MRSGSRLYHIPLASFHRPLASSPLRSAASPKDSLQLNTDHSAFLPWLWRKAGAEISSKLSIGHSTHGRSLFASKFIEAGECILKVPYKAHLTPDEIPPEVQSLFCSDVGSVARLAVVLLAEKKMDQNSSWAPYINCLPLPEEMHNTVFWETDELEMVQQSSVYQETQRQKDCIEKEYLLVNCVLAHFPCFMGPYSLQDFMHAYAIVGSRAWRTTKGSSLIPFADFLNHDGTSEAVLLSNEFEESSEVIADRDYSVGEQVCIRYGKFSNATLLLDFGFTLSHNKYDQVGIVMDVPEHDFLRMKKLDLLHKYKVPMTKENTEVSSSGFSFTIKEVRHVEGKGKGIPQSLRAFSRILSATTREELDDMVLEAAENDGRLARRPLKKIVREIQAHKMLISHITHLIRGHESSIESLGSLESFAESGQKSIRRRMARDLLVGELRVLHSACSWLANYTSNLLAAC